MGEQKGCESPVEVFLAFTIKRFLTDSNHCLALLNKLGL